mmetsp:Transcript_17028/g.46675  ORF Transcript_17028/g.46675 Transcript_17028/m.46675 type:complete len:81 (-) Transcript_17028:298-540(-)
MGGRLVVLNSSKQTMQQKGMTSAAEAANWDRACTADFIVCGSSSTFVFGEVSVNPKLGMRPYAVVVAFSVRSESAHTSPR